MYYPIIMTVKAWILLFAGTWVFASLIGKADGDWIKRKPLGIMAGYYALGMFGHSYWIAYAVMVATLPLIAKSRTEAAALFVIALGSITELSNPLVVNGTYLLFLDKWICLSIGLTLVLILRPRVGPQPGWRFHLPFLILLVLELAQARDLNATAMSRIGLGVLLSEGLPYFALVLSIGRPRDLRRLMLALIYLGFILSIIAGYEAVTHQFVYQPIDGQLNSGGVAFYKMVKTRGGILRAPTSFSDSTNFAQFLVIAFMATLAYRPYFRSTRKLGAILGLIGLGIFVTSTRNAWAGLLVSILAFDLYRRRYVALSGKAAALGIMYGTLLLLAQFVPYFSTMMGNSAYTSSTSSYRSQLLTRGLEEFQKHPYLGIDPASVVANMQDMTQGEGIVDFVNGYLYYALTAGIGGLIGLALVFLLPSVAMLNIRRSMAQRQLFLERTAAFMFAIGLNYFICTAFTGFGGHGSLFFYLTLGIGAVLFSWRRIPAAVLTDWDAQKDVPDAPVRAKPVPLIH